MLTNWQEKIGKLVRETYAREGYTDITIAIGAIAPNGDIHTQLFPPADTAGDFDIRFMWFAMNAHLFMDYNDIKGKLKDESNNQ